MSDFSQLFLYIPGAIIFLVGSGQVRRWMRLRNSDVNLLATVISCVHVTRKDKKDRDIYDYFNVNVEYSNPKTGHTERQVIKSPTEYAVGQEVRIYREDKASNPMLTDNEDIQLFHPLTTMFGGVLLILLALWQNQQKEVPAMACLSLILAGAGVSLILNYVSLRKRNLKTIDSEIIEVYTRQISKETKLLRGNKYTYYPVVRYQLNGKEARRRCNINSSSLNTFKKGEHMNLYYDEAAKLVTEKNARIGTMIAGVVLLVLGLLSGASILSVVL